MKHPYPLCPEGEESNHVVLLISKSSGNKFFWSRMIYTGDEYTPSGWVPGPTCSQGYLGALGYFDSAEKAKEHFKMEDTFCDFQKVENEVKNLDSKIIRINDKCKKLLG